MKNLFLIVLIFSSGFALSQQDNKEGIGKLKMTPEQKEKNIAIHKKFNKDLAELNAKQQQQTDQLNSRHKKQIDRLHEKNEKETDRIYTPEQQKILQELRAKRERQNQKYK